MGMYTELHFNAELKGNVPKNVIDTLKYMINKHNDIDFDPSQVFKHQLFSTDRWPVMLQCDSYYFSADTNSTLRYDDIAKSYFLCIRSNLKNYDGEIEHFIDWIHPYLDELEGDYLGHYRYEEDDIPTLIFKNRVVRLSADQIASGFTVWEMEE